jgi:hypothetical protein
MKKRQHRPIHAAVYAIFSVAVALSAQTTFATDYRYATYISGTRYESITTIVSEGNDSAFVVETLDPEQFDRHRLRLDDHLCGLEWGIARANGEWLAFVRAGLVLEISGARDGKSVRETREIDEAPWFASIPLGLSGFMKTGDKTAEFWTINPENLKPYKLIAKKKETSDITVQGILVNAVRIQVSASGVPAMFFSMDFWMRETDGLCLKFEGKKGGPGSAKVVSEFISEED